MKNMIPTPGWFRPPYNVSDAYSGKNIENFFYNYWNKNSISGVKRTYLPIYWTSFYLSNGWPTKGEPRKPLQKFIKNNIHKKDTQFFTIVQNDDGILEPLPKNVLVFGAGGIGDIPIPLIKKQRPFTNPKKNITVSFVGELSTHPIRQAIHNIFNNDKGYYNSSGLSVNEFYDITGRSIFTLCPRGYGRTSFRMYEAMSVGSIPIYIWDHVEWLPYKGIINWDDISISINSKQLSQLPQIIKSYTPNMIREKQNNINKLYKKYFTLTGTCEQIIKTLQSE